MTDSDNNFYKQLSEEMRAGLKNIYHHAATATEKTSTDALFNEATDQLDEVVKATETAAMNIMEIVEKRQELAQEAQDLLDRLGQILPDNPDVRRLAQINTGLELDLTTLMTTLSFQDITGQRIKRAMQALTAIEHSVLELYLSSGLALKAAEQAPQKDASLLREEVQNAVKEYKEAKKSELKGPDKNAPSQAAIDDMLSQLGL